MAMAQVEFQKGTKATITNKIRSPMTLDRSHNWQGRPEGGKFPDIIAAEGEVKFTHDMGPMFGSKGAVQFSWTNPAGVCRAWILAWNAPAQLYPETAPNRVYAISGYKAAIDKMSWDHIEKLLNKASDYTVSEEIEAGIKHDDATRTAALNATVRLLL